MPGVKMIKNQRNKALCAAVLVLFVMSSFTVTFHKYYLGLTEVNINTEKQTLDVSIKLFIDDLETELNKLSGKKNDLAAAVKNKETEKLLFTYLEKNFRINVGGKLQELKSVGYEIEADAAWCYLEVDKFRGKGTVSILNTLLYESFPEQSNLMNVTWNGVSKSAKLSYPEKLAEFVFE
jgi:ribosome-associated translation inhibitor RaiA